MNHPSLLPLAMFGCRASQIDLFMPKFATLGLIINEHPTSKWAPFAVYPHYFNDGISLLTLGLSDVGLVRGYEK